MTTDANTITMKAVAAKGSVSVVHGAAFLGGHYILRLYLDGKLNTDSLVRVMYIRDQYQYLLAEGYGGEFLKFSSPNTHRAFELASPAKLLICDIYVYGQTGVIAKGIMHLMWVPEALISEVGPTIDLVGPKGDKGDPGHYYRPSLRPEGAAVFVDWMHSEKPNENIKGYINIRGPKGDTGIQGPPGLDGTVKFEDLTDEQLESLKGEKGDKGDKGDDGAQGPRGFTGPQGPQGPQGGIGLPGVDGVDGKDGTDGADGVDGKDGKDGLNGSDGIGISSVTLDKRQVESGNSPNPYAYYLIITFTDGSSTEVLIPDISSGADGADGEDGADGADGEDGKDGVGIASIVTEEILPSSGDPGGTKVIITLNDEAQTKTEFTIDNGATGQQGEPGAPGTPGANGADGAPGKDGIGITNISTQDIAESTGTPGGKMVTITYGEGDKTESFNIYNGQDGQDGGGGSGIQEVALTGTGNGVQLMVDGTSTTVTRAGMGLDPSKIITSFVINSFSQYQMNYTITYLNGTTVTNTAGPPIS